MVDNGLDKYSVILAFCSYCSEDDVKNMMESNEFVEEEEKEEVQE